MPAEVIWFRVKMRTVGKESGRPERCLLLTHFITLDVEVANKAWTANTFFLMNGHLAITTDVTYER